MSSLPENFRITPGAEGIVKSLGLRCVQDGWREDLPGKIINDRGDRQVLRIPVSESGRVVYLKRWRFTGASFYHSLPGKRALRHRAATEFENLHQLKSIGIRVPEPLFLAEERGTWGPVATLLLLEGLVDYVPASEWIQEHPEGVEFLCEGIARLIATLHRNGYYYRSPGLKHFYVRKQEPDSTPPGIPAKERAVTVDSRFRGNDEKSEPPRESSFPRKRESTATTPPLQVGCTGTPDEGLALIDVPRLDRRKLFLPKSLWWGFGADPPCPERDLSKVILTLTHELQASESHLEAFWSTYCSEAGVDKEEDTLRLRVKDLAFVRSGRRKRNKK
jgi:hypothetical protein